MEATSSPGWHSHRRASRPNFCSGHLYVGSSNSACPAHPPKSNSQPSPPTRKPTPSTVPPSRGAVLPSSRRLRPAALESHRSPLSLAAHVRAIGQSHERHVLTASRTPRTPLQASIASACRSRPVVTLPGLRLPSTPWNLSPAQQPSGPIKHRPADATPPPWRSLGFRVVSRNKNQRPTTAALLSDQCLLTFMPCACTEWRRFRSPGVPQQKAPSSPCAAAGLGAPRGGFWQLRPGHTLSRA